jgi:hypothetical protein
MVLSQRRKHLLYESPQVLDLKIRIKTLNSSLLRPLPIAFNLRSRSKSKRKKKTNQKLIRHQHRKLRDLLARN